MTQDQAERMIALLTENNNLLAKLLASSEANGEVLDERLQEIDATLQQINGLTYGVAADAVANQGQSKLPYTDHALNSVDGVVSENEETPIRPRVYAAIMSSRTELGLS